MPSPTGSQRERGSPEEGERPSSLDGVSFIRIIRFLRVSEADRPGGSLHLCGRRRKRKKRTRPSACSILLLRIDRFFRSLYRSGAMAEFAPSALRKRRRKRNKGS